jgi:transposase
MSNNVRIKKQYSNDFKFKVAFAALRGDKTLTALCKEFGLHESQINRWKKVFKERGSSLFAGNEGVNHREAALSAQIDELNQYIGELTVELKFLKKSLNL